MSELDLVNGGLLGRERRDLVRGNDDIFALLLAHGRRLRASSCRAGCVLRASGSISGAAVLGLILGRAVDVPNANGAVCATRDEDSGFSAPAQRPDAAFSVAAHAFEESAWSEVPDEDKTLVVGGREELAVIAAGQGADSASVAGEHAHGIAGGDGPHADGMVTASGEDVGAIGMEADVVDILVVTDEDALLAGMVANPETSGFVMAARDEIMAVGSPG